MKAPVTRREFVQQSALVLAGLGTAVRVGGAAAAETPSRLCVACRDVMFRYTGEPDCWAAAKVIGIEGFEGNLLENLSLPSLYHPQKKYSLATPAAIEELSADLTAAGLRITALCMATRFEEQAEKEIQWAVRAAQAAQALRIKAIRIDVVAKKLKNAEFLEFSVPVLKKMIAATEGTGVAFGIENHGHTTNDPEFLKPLLDRVGSPRLGITLDTGNFYWYGHPLSKVYGLFEMFAPKVVHTHCKSIKYPPADRDRQRPMGWGYAKYTCPIDEGDLDFHRIVAILRKAGYRNDLCIEDESLSKFPKGEQGAVLAREARLLKTLV
jgi:sugar phosphate isomerase/epimerase